MHAEEETSILCYTELRISAVDLRIMSERILRDQICDHNWTPSCCWKPGSRQALHGCEMAVAVEKKQCPSCFLLPYTNASITYLYPPVYDQEAHCIISHQG